ncbi:lens epithelial cell protein LEP503 [Bubalus kerabau]|uniref:lens epithelial cell protein LEP503 n=1 Tax=Bubalus bubalis TaxID=89462 RepID=UPI000DBC9A82|nr:lens epithelial cell protein LEP503 [Bubalus bubalis]XP_055440128.1 lens epithelial cell protein LEP503 [Bubalus carabanensis]
MEDERWSGQALLLTPSQHPWAQGLTQPILGPRTFPVLDPGALVPTVMRSEVGGDNEDKRHRTKLPHPSSAAAHMQPRTQPLAQTLPFSLGGVLRDTGFRVPIMKMGTGWEGLQRTLKELAYILLCCWCIKELLD